MANHKSKKESLTDFSSQRDILNFRPDIRFIEPDQIDEDEVIETEAPEVPAPTLDSVKTDSDNLISEFRDIELLADTAQQRIDARAKDLIIHLDEEQDAQILDSLRRHFKDSNKKTITYDDYKKCINDIYIESEKNFSQIDPVDIEQGATDPLRNVFGTLGKQPGLGRPELEKSIQAIKPINMKDFSKGALSQLFEQLKPDIIKLILKKIKDPRP